MTSTSTPATARSIDTYPSTGELTDTTTDSSTDTDTVGGHRPAVLDATLSAPIVAALERTWHAIRGRHNDLPAVVVVLASGSDGAPAGWLKLGHFAAMRWQTGTSTETNADTTSDTTGNSDGAAGEALPEVFVGGEGLARGPVAVLETLLHEATHALAHTRGIKDTSRQGRNHNQRFADLARSVGLDVTQITPIGWSHTSVSEATAVDYATELADLAQALTIFRRTEAVVFAGITTGPDDTDDVPGTRIGGGDTTRAPGRRRPARGGRASSNNGIACVCECGRRIRVAPTTLAAGPITCGNCSQPFAPA